MSDNLLLKLLARLEAALEDTESEVMRLRQAAEDVKRLSEENEKMKREAEDRKVIKMKVPEEVN